MKLRFIPLFTLFLYNCAPCVTRCQLTEALVSQVVRIVSLDAEGVLAQWKGWTERTPTPAKASFCCGAEMDARRPPNRKMWAQIM